MSELGQVSSHGPVRKTLHAVATALALLAVLCIVIVLLATVADVLRRSLAGESVPGVVELSDVMMVAIVFLGLGYAERQGAHVSMTLLVRKLPPRAAAILNGLGLLLIMVIVAWMVWVTADRALESIETQEYRFGLVRVPVWPARVAIAVGLATYLLELALRLLDNVRTARGSSHDQARDDQADDEAPAEHLL